MVCQQVAHLFEVRLQCIFLGALFFKVALLLQVTPGSLKVHYPDYPAYYADHPSYDQGEDLDNVLSVGSVLGADVCNQHPPKLGAKDY
jgi:hypothetical protein